MSGNLWSCCPEPVTGRARVVRLIPVCLLEVKQCALCGKWRQSPRETGAGSSRHGSHHRLGLVPPVCYTYSLNVSLHFLCWLLFNTQCSLHLAQAWALSYSWGTSWLLCRQSWNHSITRAIVFSCSDLQAYPIPWKCRLTFKALSWNQTTTHYTVPSGSSKILSSDTPSERARIQTILLPSYQVLQAMWVDFWFDLFLCNIWKI